MTRPTTCGHCRVQGTAKLPPTQAVATRRPAASGAVSASRSRVPIRPAQGQQVDIKLRFRPTDRLARHGNRSQTSARLQLNVLKMITYNFGQSQPVHALGPPTTSGRCGGQEGDAIGGFVLKRAACRREGTPGFYACHTRPRAPACTPPFGSCTLARGASGKQTARGSTTSASRAHPGPRVSGGPRITSPVIRPGHAMGPSRRRPPLANKSGARSSTSGFQRHVALSAEPTMQHGDSQARRTTRSPIKLL